MRIRTTRGFTLIELLVVIAIIGILSSVIIVNLNSARGKGNDARRVSDLKQVQLALEMYYDANNQYPTATSDLVPTYMPKFPNDPKNDATYHYSYTASTNGVSYLLSARLENDSHPALKTDIDGSNPGGITGSCDDPMYCLMP